MLLSKNKAITLKATFKKARLQFANAHTFNDFNALRHVLWSDTTIIKLFGLIEHDCMWRKKEEAWEHHPNSEELLRCSGRAADSEPESGRFASPSCPYVVVFLRKTLIQ